jgi:hypothetical protein
MISVIYCTREPNPKHTEHIKKTSGVKAIEVIEIVNNGESLTKSYNRGYKQAKNDIVVFMHDDVSFDTSSWGNKLIKHFQNTEFGILGLAGTTDIPSSGKWWEDRKKMVGIVNHQHGGKKWESKYSKSLGNDIAEVVIIDGLFFAVDKNRIKETFNESVEGFHFYEIDFVFRNYLSGVKIGVMFNIRVTHNSIGLTNEQWDINRKQFIETYADKLPQSFVPDFYQDTTSEQTSKFPIRAIIQSFGDIEVAKNLITKIKSFDENIKINLITNDTTYDEFTELNSDTVKVYEGFYTTLPKNLSIVKFEDGFIQDNELVFLMNDKIEILNNIFVNFSKIYASNKNSFGAGFPMSYNDDKTVFSSSLNIFTNPENRIAIDMKDNGSYYNVYYGQIVNPIGNLTDCMVTTGLNLKLLDYLKLNYDTPIYFNEFALRLYLRKKTIYNDTNSLTIQKSFKGETTIQQDFQNLINFIGSDTKLQTVIKQIK